MSRFKQTLIIVTHGEHGRMLDMEREQRKLDNFNDIVAVTYRPLFVLLLLHSWDDSSSVSSGLSDTLDNISTDDLNTPVYSAGGSSRKSRGGGGGAQVGPQNSVPL